MRIKEVILQTSQLDQQQHFYHVQLGMPVLEYSDTVLRLQCGNSVLTFEVHHGETIPYYHFAFNMTPNKLDSAIQWIRELVIAINLVEGREVVHSNSWNSDSIYFYDPAGNIVELIARHLLTGESGEMQFNFNDLLGISEIGLPVTDVTEVSAVLTTFLQEQVYLNSDELFAPIGDEEGLFILSSTERNWLGSDKPVKIFPLTVEVEGSNMDSFQLPGHPYQILITNKS
ncbi:VOC family protein [Paenibacillus sp. NPDC057967]|uniref:VOC family protein n=1 Tax=Paenibacillus sp. NPDC057967 TaxID=3346293 RepID=UPI0036DF8217